MATEYSSSGNTETSDDVKQSAQITGDIGTRSAICKRAIAKTCTSCIVAIRRVMEKECFAIMDNQKYKIKEIAKEFEEETIKAIEEEMDLLFEQEGITNYLNKLDALYLEQKQKYGRESVWRPSHSAEHNVAAHLYPVQDKHKSDLAELLKRKNNEIEVLMKRINKGRRQIEEVSDEISQISSNVKQDSI